MKHKSIPVQGQTCEFINVQPMNPLISKCQIKVCYVSDEPNRNRSIITKEVAREMANSLPGSPIVGYYNEASKDFEEHNRTIKLSNGNFEIEDATRPYGFVDMNAKCWFQKFFDDDSVEREYLVTEGYIWTGQYPESRRIMEKGNNQSMELDENTLDATWTKDENGKPKFFIINEAVISKLCILGEECEPCFEGSNITPIQFSFSDSFQNEMLSMMKELKEYLLSKGGTQVFTTYAVEIGDSLWNALYSYASENSYSIDAVLTDGEKNFAVLKDAEGKAYRLDFSVAEDNTYSFAESVEAMEDYTPSEEPQFALADVEAFENEFKCGGGSGSSSDDKKKKKEFKEDKKEEGKKDESDKPNSDDNSEGEKSGASDKGESDDEADKKDAKSDDEGKDDEEDKKKKKYSLEEIPEYVELASKFSELETKYNALETECAQLKAEVEPLRQFKADADKKDKQAMIDSFCMLSDEDKKDVIDNIDTYSLDDIEAKLSIICVRNKVSFNLDDDNKDNKPHVFNLEGDALLGDSSTPAWVKAALDVAKTLN